MSTNEIYVVVHTKERGSWCLVEAHNNEEDANAVVRALNERSDGTTSVEQVVLKSAGEVGVAKSKSKKKVKSADRIDSGLEDEDGAEEPAPKKKPAPKKAKLEDDENPRNQIPSGIPRALEGIKVIYSGTMQLNRDTCKATAERYGATVVGKLEQADYIVLGANPGDKKLLEIREKGLETIAESDFFTLLKTGVPREKRHRMALAAAAAAAADDEDSEPAPKKQRKK